MLICEAPCVFQGAAAKIRTLSKASQEVHFMRGHKKTVPGRLQKHDCYCLWKMQQAATRLMGVS